jgi:hypothetical protein
MVVRRAVIGAAANVTVPEKRNSIVRPGEYDERTSLTKHPLPVLPGPSHIRDTHRSTEYDQDSINIKCRLDIQISTKPSRVRCY